MKINKIMNLISASDIEFVVYDLHHDTFERIRLNYCDDDRKAFERALRAVDILAGEKHVITDIDVNSVTHRLEIRVTLYTGGGANDG